MDDTEQPAETFTSPFPKRQVASKSKARPLTGPIAQSKVDVGRAVELRFKGLSYEQIGKLLGVTHGAIQARLAKFKMLLADPDCLNVYQENQLTFLKALDLELGLGMAAKVHDRKSSINNLAFAKSKIFEQIRLLEGKSTSNISSLTRVIMAAHKAEIPDSATNIVVEPDESVE